MRKALGMAIAAGFLAAAPASAQMRRAPARVPVEPMRLPSRVITPSPPRLVRPPVRVLYVHPAPVASQPARSVLDPTPSLPASSLPTAPSSPFLSSGQPSLTFAGGTPIPLGQLLNPTPGLGFDYSHLAAVNSGLAVRAFIDPATEHELAIAESLPQQQPVGFFPTYAYGGEPPVPSGTSQPEVIVLQQPAAQPAPAAPIAPPAPAAAAAPPAPPIPVGSLYLVRRNGSVIRAVAFSQDHGQVVYITTTGLRHSIAVNELDIHATEERNAEHGTIVHLSE